MKQYQIDLSDNQWQVIQNILDDTRKSTDFHSVLV